MTAPSFEVPWPEILPIFPLPGVLLLPRGRLPLNIFEPRYLHMILDALGEGRMIGMVQTTGPEPHPVRDSAGIYDIGCAGRISAFAETDDGRLLVTLTGVSRYRIGGELEMVNGYRRVRPDYAEFEGDLADAEGGIPDRSRLLEMVRAYFGVKQIEADWNVFGEASDEAVVTSLSMLCPLAPGEKQALLESASLGERGEMLTSLLEMAVRGSGVPSTTAPH